MFDFTEKFIINKKVDQFKVILLHGDDEYQIKFILKDVRKYFKTIQHIDSKKLNDSGLIENILLTNDIFSEKEVYLIEKIDEKNLKKSISTIEKFIDTTQNILIITYQNKLNFAIQNQRILPIQCNSLTEKEKYNYITQEIKNYKIKLSDEQTKFLSNLFRKEDILSIKNELHKLYIYSIEKNEITNSEIETLFDIPNHEEIRSLLRAIIYKDKKAFEICTVIIENYSPVFLVRSVYNYFFSLLKVMLLIKIKKQTFSDATKTIYGVIIDHDILKLKSHLRYFKIPIISKILKHTVKIEIEVKSKQHLAKSTCIKFVYDLINNFVPEKNN
jgi:hypothetical protein